MLFTTKNKSNVTFTTFSLLVERNGNTSCIFAFFFFFWLTYIKVIFLLDFVYIYIFLVTMLKKISRATIDCVVAAAKHLRKTTHPIESESKTTETGILLTSSFSLLFLLVWLNHFFFLHYFSHICVSFL